MIDIIRYLQKLGIEIQVTDPFADPEEVETKYGLTLLQLNGLKPSQSVIFAVPHNQYIEMGWEGISPLLLKQKDIVLDIKSVLDPSACPKDINLWRV